MLAFVSEAENRNLTMSPSKLLKTGIALAMSQEIAQRIVKMTIQMAFDLQPLEWSICGRFFNART